MLTLQYTRTGLSGPTYKVRRLRPHGCELLRLLNRHSAFYNRAMHTVLSHVQAPTC